MSEFYLKVAGVTFEGRQRVIAGLKEGQPLRFEPDPSNPYDSSAVKIVTADGTEVGFVSRDRNSQIFDNLMNHRGEYQVFVSSITGGGFGSNYGCNIRVVYTEKSNNPMNTKTMDIVEEEKTHEPKTNIHDFVIQDGRLVECRASGYSLVVRIPDGVREIGPRVFDCLEHEGSGLFSEWRSIDKILVPDSVTSIGHEAFYQCTGLTSIMLPNSVTSIGYAAFRQCPSLESIVIPDSVTSIGEEAFGDCISLTSINLPDGITDIDKWTFGGCENLKSIKIPDSVTSIGEGAFYGCISIASINLPDGIKSISERVFSVCKSLESVVIPDSVTSIGVKAFADCGSLENIKIPDSVTSIGDWAFWDCKNLESIVIPDGVVSIGERAFFNCTSLESVVIPDGVANIGNGAFDGCKHLVLRVQAGSYAEVYAKNNNIAFETIGASIESEIEMLQARVGEKSLIEQRLERIATTIKYALKGNYSEISEVYEPFEALGGGIFLGPSSTPVEIFRLWPADYSRLLNDAPSKYVIEIVAGAFGKGRSGEAVRSIEIRTPISVVEDNWDNESFVQACCCACGEVPKFKGCLDIKLINGYTMAFLLLPEDSFLNLSSVQQHECLVNYIGVVEDCANFIRNSVAYFGY